MAHATTGIAPALTRVMRRELDVVAREIVRARRGAESGVHRARVASRRLREALALAAAAGGPDGRTLERDVRRLTRALGGVREMDVARGVLRDLARAPQWRPGVVARIDRECARLRERRRKTLLAKLETSDVADLVGRIKTLIASIERAAKTPEAPAILAARVRRRAKVLVHALDAAGTLYAIEPLHQARLAAKKLRYILELVQQTRRMPVGREIRRVKDAQTRLGAIHDLQVVQERVQALASKADLDRTTTRQLAEFDRYLETRCREMHAKFLKSAPRLRALAEHMTRDLALRFVKPRVGRMARILSLPRATLPMAAGGHR